jgi:hypothetical protein
MLARRPRLKRAVKTLGGVVAAWCAALVVAGYAAAGCQQRKVEARIAKAFEGDAAFGDAQLSLLRGTFGGDDLKVTKTSPLGTMTVTVGRLEADLPPLGWALVDAHLRELRLRDVELTASTLELLRPRNRGGKPFSVDGLVLDDVHLVTAPATVMPALGRLEVTIEHARAGPTVLRTALSWVFSLDELVARIDVGDGVTVKVEYRDGKMKASGGVFGGGWVEVPFVIPVLEPAHELEQLATMGIDLAEKMTVRQAEGWLQRGWDAMRGAVQ